MEPHDASPRHADPDATEFVRFCYRRRRVGWPDLYDEMCAVASRGLFRGMGSDELAGLGIGFSLFDMPALASLALTVVAEEQALRRPVAVAIVAEPIGFEIERATVDDTADTVGHMSELEPATPVERSLDVPIRLSAAPAGA